MVLLSLDLISMTALAADIKQLTVRVPVDSSSPMDLKRGFRQAFRVALCQCTGDSKIDKLSAIKLYLKSPDSFVSSYQILAPKIKDQEEIASEGHNIHLEVTFNKEQIKQMLIKANVPMWGKQPPSILAWVALDSPDGQQIFSTNGFN